MTQSIVRKIGEKEKEYEMIIICGIMKDTYFNELAARAFKRAKEKGFHDVKHTEGHYMMLVICEMAEAVEADREGRRADRKTYEFLLAEYGEALMKHLFEMHIKDSVEDELADAVIRLLDYVGMKGYEIQKGYITDENIEKTLDKTYRNEAWENVVTFAERMYISCINNLTKVGHKLPEATIFSLFAMAKLYDIDLMWYVKEKMKYNETREYMHGKKY